MNYNEVYEGTDYQNKPKIDRNWFFSSYDTPKQILMMGFIDLDKAQKRKETHPHEDYFLLVYNEGDTLPEGYRPLEGATQTPDKGMAVYTHGVGAMHFLEENRLQLVHYNFDDANPQYTCGNFADRSTIETIVIAEQIEKGISAYKAAMGRAAN